MKKTLPWVILFIVGVFFLSDHAGNKNSLKKIEREYLDYKNIQTANVSMLNKKIDEKEGKISELNGAMDSANTVIANLEDKVAGKDNDLAALRKKWGAFSLECQTNLRELDSVWTGKFGLAQDEIAEYKRQVKLADERDIYRVGQILDLRKIIEAKDLQLVACEKASSEVALLYLKAQRLSRLKTWAAAGLVAVGFLLGNL